MGLGREDEILTFWLSSDNTPTILRAGMFAKPCLSSDDETLTFWLSFENAPILMPKLAQTCHGLMFSRDTVAGGHILAQDLIRTT